MNLEKFRKLVGSSKGVLAYFALDKNGRSLTQHKGPLAESIKQGELATWLLNYFYAIDTYYPESRASFLRFESLVLYLRRDGPNQFAVVLNHESNLAEFDAAFSGLCSKGNTSLPQKTTEKGTMASRKGETMLLRISDSGPTTAPTPVSATAGLKGKKAAEKKNGAPIGLIVGVLALLIALGAGAAVLLSLGQDEPSGQVVAAEPEQPPEPVNWEAKASENRETMLAVKALAEAQRNVAGAETYVAAAALERAAEADLANGEWEGAARQFEDAIERYGQSLLASEKGRLVSALRRENLDVLYELRPEFVPQVRLVESEAQDLMAAGEYALAVEAYEGVVAQLDDIKREVVRNLESLGREAEKEARQSGASAFDKEPVLAIYRRLVLIDPDNAQALAYLFRHAFEPGETFENAIGMTLAYVPPGTFTMGTTPENDPFHEPDEVAHEVTLTRGIFMGIHEVTQQQWKEVMQQPIRMERDIDSFLGNNLPAHSITWEQARQFCERLSEMTGETYRLPTEAEWEYAARAGSQGLFGVGDGRDLGISQANIFNPTLVESRPMPVGSSGPANRWGLFDMHGNVREWTATWRGPYPQGPVTDPTGPADDEIGAPELASKIVRGGGFDDEFSLARSGNRLNANPVLANQMIGFRVVREVTSFAE